MSARQSPFDLNRIRDETFVHHVEFHWRIGSTNDRALELTSDASTVAPRLVLAQQQTHGRGRATNPWWSDAGSLTFSILLNPADFLGDRVPELSLTAGLAICQAMEQIAPTADIGLKWPNDVYLADRKLGGVLVEMPPVRPARVVVGIGLNVNNSIGNAPAEIAATAISLRDALEVDSDLTQVLITCLNHLERRFSDNVDTRAALADQWRAYDILRGRTVSLSAQSSTIIGTCLGIDDDGALLVDSGKQVHRLQSGVVESFR